MWFAGHSKEEKSGERLAKMASSYCQKWYIRARMARISIRRVVEIDRGSTKS